MTPEQTADQLELAAKLIRTGHPWEYYPISYHSPEWLSGKDRDPLQRLANNCKIRPTLATPPDGRALHNPDGLTAEQVGIGYRLTVNRDSANQPHEFWSKTSNSWNCGCRVESDLVYFSTTTYRLPLSVPWPEKPDPYAELKAAHATGKVIQSFNRERGIWQDCPSPAFEGGTVYRIKSEPPPFILPPPPPGMQWHRVDGWKEGDLPEGTRPHFKGEPDVRGDEWKISGLWNRVGTRCGIGSSERCCHRRTTRPLVFTHAGKEWTWHRVGDPMPCDGERLVILLGGEPLHRQSQPQKGAYWLWQSSIFNCIGWRYAEPETKEVELGPEDVKPFTVIRRKGEAQAWHWRTVSYVDAVKVTCGNRGYGWDELASDYERNESIPLTGKWNPEAWEKCSKTATVEQP